ncbi:hypothetical protein [Sphaerisporangium perillae]|uniref:hypothetical protein n=1 Tax=Sphaerisporangium perillae TaxID=2935860 RepID=UPI0020103772|nr:hypothetical protein [Sphaerisporangium perillae]
MNHAAVAIATAVTFLWLGMVLAISFLEAPLKFRAPGVSPHVGLAIGRLVFRALNRAEAALAAAMLVAVVASAPSVTPATAALVAAVALAVQIAVVRPRLNRRTDRVLAGEDAPPPIAGAPHLHRLRSDQGRRPGDPRRDLGHRTVLRSGPQGRRTPSPCAANTQARRR